MFTASTVSYANANIFSSPRDLVWIWEKTFDSAHTFLTFETYGNSVRDQEFIGKK